MAQEQINEDIKWLERQLEAKKRELAGGGPETKEEREIVKEVIKETVTDKPNASAPAAKLSDNDAKKSVLDLKEKEHGDIIQNLVQIAFSKNLLSALKVAESLNNPHILDEFHDTLADQYYQKLLNARRVNKISGSLGLQLFLVSVPELIKENENPNEAQKNFIAQMEKFLVGLSGVKKGDSFSLELACHNNGSEIFFYVAFPRKSAQLLESQLHGAFPEAKIDKVNDYNIFHPEGTSRGATLGLAKNGFLPIKTYQKLESDPLETITSAFSKINEYGEGAALQLVLRPAGKKLEGPIHKVIEKLKEGRPRKEVLGEKNIAEEAISIFKAPGKKSEEKISAPVYDEGLVKRLEGKAAKPIFDINARLIVSAGTPDEADRIMKEFEAGFYQFTDPEGNGIKPINIFGKSFKQLVENFSFRLFDQTRAVALNVEEIVSLYHFPYSKKAARKVKVLKSRGATPPVNLPKEGILIGKSAFRGEEREVRIKKDDRRRHFYTIGQTGTGKSVLLQNMIVQDIKNGEGVAVIDPHGELIEKVLELVPRERAEDVIYFDPGDVQ